MKAIISEKSEISGKIIVPPSKSYSHRAFFFALINQKPTIIKNPLTQGDVEKTINAVSSIGCQIRMDEDLERMEKSFIINPPQQLRAPHDVLDCGNSGTTIRILTALSLIIDGTLYLKGEFFVKKRPIDELYEALNQICVLNDYDNKLKDVHQKHLKVKKNLSLQDSQSVPNKDLYDFSIGIKEINANNIKIRGDISSQFITGLIIAGCGLALNPKIRQKKNFQYNELIISTTTPPKSFPYILLTIDVANEFGIPIFYKFDESNNLTITISMNNFNELNKMNSDLFNYKIPADYSSASFPIVASLLHGSREGVQILGISENSVQGDSKIVQIIKSLGAKIEFQENSAIIYPINKDLIVKNLKNKGIDIFTVDFSDIPDLFPILCVLGAYLPYEFKFKEISHIRLKESDRVSVMVRELKKFGVDIVDKGDCVIIKGKNEYSVSQNHSCNHESDHRIIMSLIIFSMGLNFSENSSVILDSIEKISDSYPGFINDFKKLGLRLKEFS